MGCVAFCIPKGYETTATAHLRVGCKVSSIVERLFDIQKVVGANPILYSKLQSRWPR